MPASSYDVAIVRSNSLFDDPRASKIARALSEKYRVIALGWDRSATNGSFVSSKKTLHTKYLKLRAPRGKIHLILYYPLFWSWILGNLLTYKPKIVHACDFDTLLPSYFYKLLYSAKLVFDSFDRYAMAFIPPKHHIIYRFVNMFENMLAGVSNALVTVSQARLSTFGVHRPRFSEVIMNCPEDRQGLIRQPLDSCFRTRKELTLVYAGLVRRDRGLILLRKAMQNIKGVRLILAGRIYDGTIQEVLRDPKFQYVGVKRYDEALALEKSADVIPILYDPSTPINRVANPNKLFEAMMLGVPVVANVCSEIVRDVGCGLVVRYDAKDVENAIRHFKDNPTLRRQMGAKGRMAFERDYNWPIMKRRLLGLYNRLFANN